VLRFVLSLCLLASTFANIVEAQDLLDNIAIHVIGESREFVFTNKQDAYFYGETGAPHRNSWQGFNVFGRKFIDDYAIVVDGIPLERSSASEVVVYPDYLERRYPGGIIEQVRICDSVAMFALILTSVKPVEFSIRPLISDARTVEELEIAVSEGTGSFARRNHTRRTPLENYPVWVALHGSGFLPEPGESGSGNSYSPLLFSSRRSKTRIISFAVADTRSDAETLAKSYNQSRAARFFRSPRSRMETLLRETSVATDNSRFDQALAWAKLSLDALVMNQQKKGIFAGLPWFNNYWGRDTFISLPGAALVTGRFDEAKDILRSFADLQQRDSTSSDYGRIPNTVTTSSTSHNTADGTPRFVIMTREYVMRSGDSAFVREAYPAVIRAIEGTLRYHTDTLGFLTHGDSETWMDAVGPNGAWTPRGNRANDIQALWAHQLEAGIWFASVLGDASSASRWNEALQRLRSHFPKYFVHRGRMYDHLNQDGTPDLQVRPNQIFALGLVDESTGKNVLEEVVSNLTQPFGVSSLGQFDDDFHPYHHFNTYPKDAAYHNGVVWTWLQGPVISELCRVQRSDLAFLLTENSIHQILDRGAVGTQSELLDAFPRPGEKEPRISGTFSQAWNLAEFVRNFYDDYAGLRVDRYTHVLNVHPRPFSSLGRLRAKVNMNGTGIPVDINLTSLPYSIAVDGKLLRKGGTVDIMINTDNGDRIHSVIPIPPRGGLRWQFDGNQVSATVNGKNSTEHLSSIEPAADHPLAKSLTFASSVMRSNIRSLQGPEYPLLSRDQIRQKNPDATLLTIQNDALRDDNGGGHYVYPTSPHFKQGILDIQHFAVHYDHRNVYFALQFRELINPGWHPEYGFQLTYAAIAIDTDGVDSSGATAVGSNSHFVLSSTHAYEKLIFIGGGIKVENSAGKTLAEYIPSEEDVADPIGDLQARTVSFSLPLSLLGKPSSRWQFTVLVGAQDDHGGAGLGEFRSVESYPDEWHGGGKLSPGSSNVYDVLQTQARK